MSEELWQQIVIEHIFLIGNKGPKQIGTSGSTKIVHGKNVEAQRNQGYNS
jgi:hypothetical protein